MSAPTEPDRIAAYPLTWPAGWPRAEWREPARFTVSLDAARDELLRELDLMGATWITISSNALLRQDGQLAAKQPRSADPGVAVQFTLAGEPRCIPCDRWDRIEGNVRAIGLTVTSLRGLERWGAGEMVRAAFGGFAALPAGGGPDGAWWSVLDVAPAASEPEIDAAYRRLAREHHPDTGGSAARFRVIAEAQRQAKESRA